MNVQEIPWARLKKIASRLNAFDHSGKTYCLRPGTCPDQLNLPDDVGRLISSSETGAILFWSLADAHLVLPPFPVEREASYDGWRTGPLLSLLDRPRILLVFLLRLGGSAVGIFEGERLVGSKVTTYFVKARHKKGGSSSARFARRREEQARGLFDKAGEALRRLVSGYEGRIEWLICGGDRLTLQAFEKRSEDFKSFPGNRLTRILDVPDPRLKVLKDSLRLAYASRYVRFSSFAVTSKSF